MAGGCKAILQEAHPHRILHPERAREVDTCTDQSPLQENAKATQQVAELLSKPSWQRKQSLLPPVRAPL